MLGLIVEMDITNIQVGAGWHMPWSNRLIMQ